MECVVKDVVLASQQPGLNQPHCLLAADRRQIAQPVRVLDSFSVSWVCYPYSISMEIK